VTGQPTATRGGVTMQELKEVVPATLKDEDESVSFELEASEAELLEEFGVLMMWEYNYGT
jgi:hypothetical protein